MNYEKILTRIKKLLDLARNAGSEEEAASAADRAQAMMIEYQVGEAELSLLADGPRNKEPIVDVPLDPDDRRGKRITWQDALAHAVAASYGCRSYWYGPVVWVYGRESQVQAVRYTAAYLTREVNALAEREWRNAEMDQILTSPRSWKNSFRVGCAAMIAQRLGERTGTERRERRARAQAVGASKVKADALAVVQRDQDEVDEGYHKRMKGARTLRGGSGGSSGGGYQAGTQAGRGVALGGGRAALGRGQGRLK